jgi:hypothetical protein
LNQLFEGWKRTAKLQSFTESKTWRIFLKAFNVSQQDIALLTYGAIYFQISIYVT